MSKEIKIMLGKVKILLNSPRGITEVIGTSVTLRLSQKLESMNEMSAVPK